MRILLLGEYSNVHNTLALGLRALGHEVCVASNGDFWKDYPRDIDLDRRFGIMGAASFAYRLVKALPQMRGYDVVQLINPMFLELKAERLFPIYRYLRRNNKKMVMCAYGMDYYWVSVNDTIKPLRYSDFNFGDRIRHDDIAERERNDWTGTAKQRLNEMIAHDCDGIVSGLYEYWATYDAVESLRHKMQFIPFPIQCPDTQAINRSDGKVRIFIGISKQRSAYKGTDIMLRAAQDLQHQYPNIVELRIAEGLPFNEYQHMMESSDIILDQLYSYTPAMNALLAMSKGIIVCGGGEPENYDILDEHELRPIINVQPNYESCYHELEQIVLHRERIPQLKQQSVEYIRRHHDHLRVAQRYVDFYKTGPSPALPFRAGD